MYSLKNFTEDITKPLNPEDENNNNTMVDETQDDKQKFSFLGMKPIDVARFLTDDYFTLPASLPGLESKHKLFDVDQLREIAEYLTVYCNYTKNEIHLLDEFTKILLKAEDRMVL